MKKQPKKRLSLATMKRKNRATKFANKASPSRKLSIRDGWINFFEFESSGGGGGSAWREVLQATQHSSGSYDFQIWNPPTSEDDEPYYIEWSSDKPVFAAEILDQLTQGLRDRGIRKVFVLEAAAALLPHLPKVDQNLLKDSMRKLLAVDQALEEDTHWLPKRVRKLIEQPRRATVRGSTGNARPDEFNKGRTSR